MDQIVQLLCDLVAIDSVNPSLVPGGAGEEKIAKFVASWLEGAGLQVQIDEPAPGRMSVIGRVPGQGGGKSLLLNAHLDTVGVAGMKNPFKPIVEDNRLYGRGAYDMKSGLAAAMMACAGAVGQGFRGDLWLTAVCDEEYGSLGTESVLARYKADAAIVTEPTALDVCVAHRGVACFEIETRGLAAHGSRPDLGVDAISHMGRVLAALEEQNRVLQDREPHLYLGRASLHASIIHGGHELSSYPDSCRLQGERRTVPGESRQNVEKEMDELLHRLSEADPKFDAKFAITLARDPYEASVESGIASVLRRTAAAHLGHPPALVGALWWMDSALIGAAGIPTVIFGPGGEGAHSLVEWADLDQMQACSEILLMAAKEYCS